MEKVFTLKRALLYPLKAHKRQKSVWCCGPNHRTNKRRWDDNRSKHCDDNQ